MPLHKPLVLGVIVTTNPHQKKDDIVKIYQLHGSSKIYLWGSDKYKKIKEIKHVVSFDKVNPQYGLGGEKNGEES
jgi:hypothetical protein